MCLHTNIQNYKSLVCVYFSHGEGASRICYFSQNGALKCMSTDFNGKTNKPLEHKGQKKKKHSFRNGKESLCIKLKRVS